jgi:hypothetical protein
MFGPVSMGRLNLVQPTLKDIMIVLESQMSESIGITQGVRTDPAQAALWAQGRIPVDQVNALRKALGWAPIDVSDNAIVTKAKPGYSWHSFGMAVDVVPFDSQQHPDWNESHPVWQEIVTKGEALGLVSGISFEDTPHFQLVGRFPTTPDDEVRALAQTGGMQAVWQAANIQAR